MSSAIRPHSLALRLDDDTWAEFERMAQARGESADELAAYAVEQLLERAGFTPAWATEPLDVRFPTGKPRRPLSPSSDSRRRAR